MRIGPRYLHKNQSFFEPEAERTALLVSLKHAPGVLSIEGVEGHHKGGHKVSLEVDRAQLDDFIAHMDSQGWIDGI